MIKLTNRLSAVAQLVREDASLADVGCDHGYLPAYLIMNGKIKSAVACDINKGPLDSCIQLVADYSFENKIKCVLSDGLCNIAENECDDIAICGMGGELIAQILDNCTWAKNSSKHFILNPMTHPEILRKYLCDNGLKFRMILLLKKDGTATVCLMLIIQAIYLIVTRAIITLEILKILKIKIILITY